ncbi:MAG: hypothetical protein K9L65_07590, partial [Chromatiaceae bacterium]|nr:hypothetical protein [Chromatiaceae bacterium]
MKTNENPAQFDMIFSGNRLSRRQSEVPTRSDRFGLEPAAMKETKTAKQAMSRGLVTLQPGMDVLEA